MPFPSLSPQPGRAPQHVRRRRPSSLPRRVVPSIIGPIIAVMTCAAVAVVVGGPSGALHLLGLSQSGGDHQRSAAAPHREAALVPSATPVVSDEAQPRRRAPPRAATRWVIVLGRLDDERAKAWLHGEPRLLHRVYTAGSPALREDRRELSGYVRRGLHVDGVRLVFDRLRVLHRRTGFVRLRIVDRLGEMAAVAPSGDRLRLPRDRASRHEIVLRRVGGRWQIATVNAV